MARMVSGNTRSRDAISSCSIAREASRGLRETIALAMFSCSSTSSLGRAACFCSISDDARSTDLMALPMVRNMPFCDALITARWNSSAASETSLSSELEA